MSDDVTAPNKCSVILAAVATFLVALATLGRKKKKKKKKKLNPQSVTQNP